MPKRTNSFQRLILAIEEMLNSQPDVTITESAELIDRITGKIREVDILIESKVGHRVLCTGIECTDRKRRAGSPWVDEMYGKLRDLPLDRRVLVSKSGFSRNARQRAKLRGLETLSLDQAVTSDWARISTELMVGRYLFTHAGAKFRFPIDGGLTAESLERLLRQNPYFVNAQGSNVERFFDRAQRIASAQNLNAWEARGKGDGDEMLIEMLDPGENWLRDGNGDRHRIDSARLRVQLQLQIGSFQVTQSRYGDATVTVGEGAAPFGHTELLVVQARPGTADLRLRISREDAVEEVLQRVAKPAHQTRTPHREGNMGASASKEATAG